MDTKLSTGKALAGLALLGAGGVAAMSLTNNEPTDSYISEPTPIQASSDTAKEVNESADFAPTSKIQIKADANYSVTRPASSGDRDCGDFSTHSQAQAFFESAGAGDPHGLDRDGDGDACETLP